MIKANISQLILLQKEKNELSLSQVITKFLPVQISKIKVITKRKHNNSDKENIENRALYIMRTYSVIQSLYFNKTG